MLKDKINPTKKFTEKRVSPNYLKQLTPYVAGIDIGSRSHFVAAPVAAGNKIRPLSKLKKGAPSYRFRQLS